MKRLNVKKLILPNIPYVFIALLATKVSEAVRLAPGSDASTKLLNIMTGLNTAFHSLVPSFHPIDLCVGVAAAIAIRLAVYIKGKNAKKFRKNLEYGSARWGNAEDIKPYVDPAFENNIILTQTERLTMNSRPKDPKTARNKNVLIVGGSGSGKTRFWLKPNLLQCTAKERVSDQDSQFPELQEVHALQPVRLHPLGKGHFEAGHDADRQHQGRGQSR
jgi:type IV secretion system protein VirD4